MPNDHRVCWSFECDYFSNESKQKKNAFRALVVAVESSRYVNTGGDSGFVCCHFVKYSVTMRINHKSQ